MFIFWEKNFLYTSAFWVSESDSPVQPSVGREGEEQEKLTFIILKKVE